MVLGGVWRRCDGSPFLWGWFTCALGFHTTLLEGRTVYLRWGGGLVAMQEGRITVATRGCGRGVGRWDEVGHKRWELARDGKPGGGTQHWWQDGMGGVRDAVARSRRVRKGGWVVLLWDSGEVRGIRDGRTGTAMKNAVCECVPCCCGG